MAKISMNVPVRWSDLDAYGHVNNVAMLTYLEEARIKLLWARADEEPLDDGAAIDPAAAIARALADGPGEKTITVVASQQIEYIIQVPWVSEPVCVDLWVGKIGGASFDISYMVMTPAGELAAKATTTVVVVDADTGRPRRLNEAQVEALSRILEDPVIFRR